MVKKYIDEISEVEESEIEIETEEKKGFLRKLGAKRISIIILVIVAIMGVYFSFHFYNKYNALQTNSSVEAEKETQKMVLLLGKLIELPQGEVPTVATISDKSKLKDQSFFAQAENGDILFAYTTAMKAILYRPTTNKIINVAPISINQTQDLAPATKKVTATSTKSRE